MFLISLKIERSKLDSVSALSPLFVTSSVERRQNGDGAETRRRLVSTSSPLRNVSKNSFEVLRLGLGRDPIRELPTGSMPPNCIGLCIGALPLECLQGRFGRRHGGNARHPEAAMRCRRCWRHMDRTQLPDAGVLEDWLEQLACHFDRAARVAESQEALSVEELGLEEPVIGHETPPPVSRHKETANQGRPQRSTRNVALERHRSSPQ